MIVVEANLVPFGDKNLPSKYLCRLEIINDCTGTTTHGNYHLRLYSAGVAPRIIKRGEIKNWPRKSQPAWRLIAKAFETLEIQ